VNDAASENRLSLTLAAWLLALLGWAGLAALILNVDPRTGSLPVWFFFVLTVMALTGTAVPFVGYLNRRFARSPAPPSVLLRQALWFGLFGSTCAWLLKSGILSLATALLLGAGLGGVEWFLRMRERARWAPDPNSDDSA
jgi:hypothetical protein